MPTRPFRGTGVGYWQAFNHLCPPHQVSWALDAGASTFSASFSISLGSQNFLGSPPKPGAKRFIWGGCPPLPNTHCGCPSEQQTRRLYQELSPPCQSRNPGGHPFDRLVDAPQKALHSEYFDPLIPGGGRLLLRSSSLGTAQLPTALTDCFLRSAVEEPQPGPTAYSFSLPVKTHPQTRRPEKFDHDSPPQ